MYKFGFIGTGNMGYAMLKGLISKFPNENVCFYDSSLDKMKSINKELNVDYCSDIKTLVESSIYIILSIKPQIYDSILSEIKPLLTNEKIIITVAPGYNIDKVKSYTYDSVKIVRSMPNTPALVGEAMSVLSFSNDDFKNHQIEDVYNLFKSFGEVETIDESLMDAVVPISGSSPAYIYILIEAMADSGVSMGLSRDLSYKLAAQSVLGSSKMVLETKKHPGALKDAVCSPAGTTIEAVKVLEKNNFRGSIISAMDAAYKKSKSIE